MKARHRKKAAKKAAEKKASIVDAAWKMFTGQKMTEEEARLVVLKNEDEEK